MRGCPVQDAHRAAARPLHLPLFGLSQTDELRIWDLRYISPVSTPECRVAVVLHPTDLLGSHTSMSKNVVSVKGGCLEGLDWGKAVHIWTRSAMVPIPEGAETHPEEPTGSEYSTSSELSDRSSDFPAMLIGSSGCAERSAPRKTKFEEPPPRLTGACELSG
ncbi:hypothetical protein DL770_008137 [Monosporascus sp. CRB-9-2]|nr:hypothetical protein DL770_008137 [Monosporascus sp. CRB-9-2]